MNQAFVISVASLAIKSARSQGVCARGARNLIFVIDRSWLPLEKKQKKQQEILTTLSDCGTAFKNIC